MHACKQAFWFCVTRGNVLAHSPIVLRMVTHNNSADFSKIGLFAARVVYLLSNARFLFSNFLIADKPKRVFVANSPAVPKTGPITLMPQKSNNPTTTIIALPEGDIRKMLL